MKTTDCRDCRSTRARAIARIIARHVQELPSGRFVLAVWSERDAQWTASMSTRAAKRTGCSGVFARTLAGIASDPCVTKYASRAGAVRALRAEDHLDVYDDLCAKHRREAAQAYEDESARERAAEDARWDAALEREEASL